MQQQSHQNEEVNIIDSIMATGKRTSMEQNEQERNLLNALVLYVQAEKPPGALQPSTLRELITGDLSYMDQNFESLKPGHPATEPYKRFKRLNYISRIHVVLELRKKIDLLIKNRRRNYGS